MTQRFSRSIRHVLYSCSLTECCGCDAQAPLIPFTNGHRYCARCAEEVPAITGASRRGRE